MNAIEKRIELLDTRKMSSGMRSQLATIVNRTIEPELRKRVKSRDVLTLNNNAYQRKSMAAIFDCAPMPTNADGYETLGQFLRTVDEVRALLLYLKEIKQVEDNNGGWADTEAFSYLCDCIDLMLYVDDLVRIGEQTQHPQAEIKVFCQCCYRYAESKEVGARKNLRLCHTCREVEKDGQDYKQANLLIEEYLKTVNIKGHTKKSVWLRLSMEQAKESQGNHNLNLVRGLSSNPGISPEERQSAIIELINELPRLRSKFLIMPNQVMSIEHLIGELLKKMEYAYAGIKPYFLANPSHLSGILIRFDCYLLMIEAVEKQKKKLQSNKDKKIKELRSYLAEGMSKPDIADKMGVSRGQVYKLIKKYNLQTKNKGS